MLVVLVGFAVGSLFGYKGGVILVVGNGFSNNLTQYDDFVPGSLFQADDMEPFSFDIGSFDVNWLTSGPRKGMAQGFESHLTYQETPTSEAKKYDLKVNHPLSIGDTEVFLIGHGYAPVITIRDGNGDVAYSGPTIFLPTDQTFTSFGVVKAPDARPQQIGLEGGFYPTYAFTQETGPFSVFGNAVNPRDLDAGVHRRPRHGRRVLAVGLRAGQGQRGAGEERRRVDVPRRPGAGAAR